MKKAILKYLYSFEDRQYHELNDFIRQQGWEEYLFDVRQILQQLYDSKQIELFNCSSIRWTQYTRIPEISQYENVMATLDNWKLKARLTDSERDKIGEQQEAAEINRLTIENLKYAQTIRNLEKELKEAQLKDIPKNDKHRDDVLIWQIIAGVSIAVAFLLKLFGAKGWL